MEIILYTTHCPKCKVVEFKLKQKNIAYTECEDIQKMRDLNITSAPVLSVDGNLYEFTQAVEWIRNKEM